MGHGKEHSAVDIQAENQTQLDGKSCVDYAHDRAKEYAAVLRFIGLLAGIGSDEDVAEARRLVKEALSEVGLETDARQALRNRELAGIAQRKAEQALGDARAAWEWSGDRDTAWAAAGSPTGADFNRWLETGPGVPTNVMEAARNRRIAAENFDNAVRTHDEAARQMIRDLFAGLWEGFKSAYNNAVASIENGTWKTALCKLGVDAGFLIAETAVGAAIAAVLTPAVAAALKFVGKVAQQGSNLVRIGIQATRTRLAQSNAKAFAERRFSRQIDTSKELTEAEKRVLGAENQGTTTATPDAGPSQPRAAPPNGETKPPGKDAELGAAGRPRSREELLPGGKVPAGKDFAPWWNSLTPAEHNMLWQDKRIQSTIRDRVLGSGGTHEWLKRSQLNRLKELGFSMDEIKAFTSPTRKTEGPNPISGERWRHTNDNGTSGRGSGEMHRSLDELFEGAKDRNELLRRYGYWANSWLDNGIDSLPPALRAAIVQAGGG